METTKSLSHSRPVLSQTKNNTTLWIGHLQTDFHDHLGGQTFSCPVTGKLDNIQVYSTAVYHPGEMKLTLHEFDPRTKTWGPAIGKSSLYMQKSFEARWISYSLPSVFLQKEMNYGFRLQAVDALIAIGEAVHGTNDPFTFGQEWKGETGNDKGHFFTYFSMAFKVEMVA